MLVTFNHKKLYENLVALKSRPVVSVNKIFLLLWQDFIVTFSFNVRKNDNFLVMTNLLSFNNLDLCQGEPENLMEMSVRKLWKSSLELEVEIEVEERAVAVERLGSRLSCGLNVRDDKKKDQYEDQDAPRKSPILIEKLWMDFESLFDSQVKTNWLTFS